MVIIVYSIETERSISANLGKADYSYYFVLEQFRGILAKLASVVHVQDPDTEVDPIYEACKAKGESCVFFSFTPPFKAPVGLRCPTICVFAWEYATIPSEEWGKEPRNDWRNVLHAHRCAITHSTYAVKAVQQAMGATFPVWSIPAPVWDEFSKLYLKDDIHRIPKDFELSFQGSLIDCNGPLRNGSPNIGTPDFIRVQTFGPGEQPHKVWVPGIIYTAVFNPNDGRKNWLDMLWGFCWAFKDSEDVTLVLKLAYHDFDFAKEIIIHEIKKLYPFKCRILALHGYLQKDQYYRLIQGTTFVVNTAHGEGQCLPLMEFMSAGKPAIAPSHTAMEDYVNEENSFVVRSSREWYHWPHDPRLALRTFRYRLDWESLLNAYRESYQVAKSAPRRYAHMASKAVESLAGFCSQASAREKLSPILDFLVAPRSDGPHLNTSPKESAEPGFKAMAKKALSSLATTINLRLGR